MPGYRLDRRLWWPAVIASAVLAAVAGCTSATSPSSSSSSSSAVSSSPAGGAGQVSGGPSGSYIVPAGIGKIKHVIIVMQENRSFDTYFGTYPGADGIPMANGTPTVCVPNQVQGDAEAGGGCTRDCDDDSAETCAPVAQSAGTPGIWNPLPLFGDVRADHQLNNIQSLDAYFAAARAGTLPSVSWITPSQPDSEHPPASVHQGQAYATSIVNAAMESPDWTRPPSSWPGTTGAASTTTWCRPRWIRTATACGCPAW